MCIYSFSQFLGYDSLSIILHTFSLLTYGTLKYTIWSFIRLLIYNNWFLLLAWNSTVLFWSFIILILITTILSLRNR